MSGERDYGDEDPRASKLHTYDPARVILSFGGVKVEGCPWHATMIIPVEVFRSIENGDFPDETPERIARRLRKRRARIADIELAIERRKVRAFFAPRERRVHDLAIDLGRQIFEALRSTFLARYE